MHTSTARQSKPASLAWWWGMGVGVVETIRKARRTVAHGWISRTWKREIASLGLFVWAVCTIYLHLIASIDVRNASVGIYGTMTTAVFTFALAMFGYDAYLKQGQPGGLPGTQVPVGPPR